MNAESGNLQYCHPEHEKQLVSTLPENSTEMGAAGPSSAFCPRRHGPVHIYLLREGVELPHEVDQREREAVLARPRCQMYTRKAWFPLHAEAKPRHYMLKLQNTDPTEDETRPKCPNVHRTYLFRLLLRSHSSPSPTTTITRRTMPPPGKNQTKFFVASLSVKRFGPDPS